MAHRTVPPSLRGNAKRLRSDLTDAEWKLWQDLRKGRLFDLRFRRQVPIGPYVADFVSHEGRLVVEIDGDQHGTDEATAYDERRTRFLEAAGYKVVRFSNRDVLFDRDGVLDQIGRETGFLHPERVGTPHPDPPPQGGRGRKRRNDVP